LAINSEQHLSILGRSGLRRRSGEWLVMSGEQKPHSFRYFQDEILMRGALVTGSLALSS
jgi:hypothetical protein